MPPGARRLLIAGVGFTLLGLVGLAATIDGGAERLVRWLFVPLYGLGAVCLVAGGVWWLKAWSSKPRD